MQHFDRGLLHLLNCLSHLIVWKWKTWLNWTKKWFMPYENSPKNAALWSPANEKLQSFYPESFISHKSENAIIKSYEYLRNAFIRRLMFFGFIKQIPVGRKIDCSRFTNKLTFVKANNNNANNCPSSAIHLSQKQVV